MASSAHIENHTITRALPEGYTSPLLAMVEKTHSLGSTPADTERSVCNSLARVLTALATVAFESDTSRCLSTRGVTDAMEKLTMRRFDERKLGRALPNAPAWEFIMKTVLAHPHAVHKETVFCAEALHIAKRAAEAYTGELLEHATAVAKSYGRDKISPSDIELVEAVQLFRPDGLHECTR